MIAPHYCGSRAASEAAPGGERRTLLQQGPGVQNKSQQTNTTPMIRGTIAQGQSNCRPNREAATDTRKGMRHWEVLLDGYGHDWRARTLHAHNSGLLDDYEARRIFRLHNSTFPGAV